MFGDADGLGNPTPVHVRDLAWHVDRQRSVRFRVGNDSTRLHAGRDQPVVDDAQLDDLVGLVRGLRVVAAAHLVDGGDIAGDIVMKLRCTVADGGDLVDHCGQRLVVDVDQINRVVGFGKRLRDHQRHAFADEAHAIDRNDVAVRNLRSRQHPVGSDGADLAVKILPRQSEPDSRRGASRAEVDISDIGMGVRRSQDRGVEHAGQLDVVDISALAGQEPKIFAPLQRLADIAGCDSSAHESGPFVAIDCAARTML
jgi:hypothetical protein